MRACCSAGVFGTQALKRKTESSFAHRHTYPYTYTTIHKHKSQTQCIYAYMHVKHKTYTRIRKHAYTHVHIHIHIHTRSFSLTITFSPSLSRMDMNRLTLLTECRRLAGSSGANLFCLSHFPPFDPSPSHCNSPVSFRVIFLCPPPTCQPIRPSSPLLPTHPSDFPPLANSRTKCSTPSPVLSSMNAKT